MSTLGTQGVNSLLAVNSWIGLINANLQGSSRTAFKTVRPHLVDAPSVNYLGERVQIPPATLNIQATSIEWAQGAVVNSDYSTHFALQGQGFFVVADTLGRYYLSRDGEFHWDGNGYLVNSSGLRVVSSGQDFIRRSFRYDTSDGFSPDGESQQLERYGDKSFLIVDVTDRDGLTMSRYGSTVLELDGDLPLRVHNDFDTSTDGLTFLYNDPKQLTYVTQQNTAPPFVQAGVGINSDFSIDLGGNGVFNFNTFNAGNDFDPAVNTIDDVVTAINNYGIANSANVSAKYDAAEDRFTITNITAPKIVDPLFNSGGNFAIDFGDNGFFTFHDFDPKRTTIKEIVTRINQYGIQNNVNVTAVYNPVADTFTLNNDTGANPDNRIVFDGSNGGAIANMFQLNLSNASNGGGAHSITSTTFIDLTPPSTNPFSDISPQDVASLSLDELINPPSRISFGGPNGGPLAEFFRVWQQTQVEAVDPITGDSGVELTSARDIDNSDILNNPAGHDLDIQAADVTSRSFNYYLNTSDTTYPIPDFAGPPAVYTHDKVNNVIISDGTSNSGHGLIGIGQAQKTDQFEIVLDYEMNRAAASSILEFHFGYDRAERIDSSGFSLYYDTATGSVELYQRSNDPNDAPVLVQAYPAGTLPTTNNQGSPSRMALTLDKDGNFGISVQSSVAGSGLATFNLDNDQSVLTGYLALGNQSNELILHNIYADFKAFQNQDKTGQLVSLGNRPYAVNEVNPAATPGNSTRIIQNALESSTASLTEYLPLLSLAQKIFSSLSKIIQTESRLQDDMNTLIR